MKIFFLLIFFLTINTSVANADFNLAVFPPILQIEAKPPANVLTPITVENLSNEPIELDLILKPFKATDQENGQVKYLETIPQEYSLLFQRIAVLDTQESRQITQLVLGPKQKKDLTININISRETIPSDYYFSLVFVSLAGSTSADRSGTEVLGGIATNILLSVSGEREAEGVIQEFSAPLFIEKGPVPFTVRVKNTGIHYIAPKGEIIIKNLLGQTVGEVDLQPANILAGSVRSLPAEWKENIIFGPYRATLNLSLSETGPLFKRELIFFAFPGITILAGLGSLLILLFLFLRIRSRV